MNLNGLKCLRYWICLLSSTRSACDKPSLQREGKATERHTRKEETELLGQAEREREQETERESERVTWKREREREIEQGVRQRERLRLGKRE